VRGGEAGFKKMHAWQACSCCLILAFASILAAAQNPIICHGPAYTLNYTTSLVSSQSVVTPPPGLTMPYQIYENYSDGYSAVLSVNGGRALVNVLMGVNGTGNFVSGGPLNTTAVYRLVGYEFYSPSQFTLDGRAFAFELHLVHTNVGNGSDTLLLVLPFEAGGYSALVDNLLPAQSVAAATAKPPIAPVFTMRLKSLLPSGLNYYYLGQQTVTQANRAVYGNGNPNCRYAVAQTWLFMETALNCSLAQLQRVLSVAFPSPVSTLSGALPPATVPTMFTKYMSQRVVPYVPFVEDVFKPTLVFSFVFLGLLAILLFCWIHNKRRQAYINSLRDQV